MVAPVVLNTLNQQPSGQVIDGSLRFNGLDGQLSDRLLRTPSSSGDRKTFTISTWVKFTKLSEGKWFGAGNNALQIKSGGKFSSYFGQSSSLDAERQLRDPNTFYHCVCVVDTTQSDSNARIRMYVNGEYLSDFAQTSYPSEDANTSVNASGTTHYIGISHDSTPQQEFGGYLSQYYLIDGMALGPGYFGFTDPLTGTWKPKLLKQGAPTVNDGTTWSSGLSNQTGAANCFDGDLTTTYGPDGNTQTWTSPKPIQVHSQLRIFYSSGVASRNFTVNDNGKPVATGTGTKWVDLHFTGILTKIVGTNGWNCRAIEVDGVILTDDTTTTVDFGTNGFYLPMDGKTPIGEDQSGKGNDWEPEGFAGSNYPEKADGGLPILNTDPTGAIASVGVRTDTFAVSPNDGTTWSTNSVSTTGGTLSNAGDGFDGSLASSGAHCTLAATNTNTTANVTFNASIPRVTKVEVFVHSSSSSGDTRGTCEDSNGTTYTSATLTNASQAFHTIYEGPPITLANVGWGVNQNGQTGTVSDAFRAFRVNGYILKDGVSDEGLNLAVPFLDGIDDVSATVNSRSTKKNVTESSTDNSNEESNFYGYSRKWNNNYDTCSVANSGDDLVLGTGDFTVECWVYDSNDHDGNNNRCYIWDNRVGGNVVSGPLMIAYIDDHQEWNTEIGGTALTYDMSPDYTVERNRWYHFAVTRREGTVKMWVNGIERASGSNSSDIESNGIGIGYADTGGYGWAGYIQDFRVYKGVCKYTKNFMVAASKPDIYPDSPSGVVGGAQPFHRLGAGSVKGAATTSDYLQVTPNGTSDFNLDGEFTAEWFFYTPDVDSTYMWTIGDSKTSTGLELYWGTSGTILKLYTNDGGSNSSTAVHKSGWHHYAVVRDSNDLITVYYDGVSAITSTNTNTFSGNITIGGEYYNGGITGGLDGAISNFRLVNGTAVYTSNFTPPTEALTNISNTKLLCCQGPYAGSADVSPHVGITTNNGTVWSEQNRFVITTAGTTETGSLAAVFNSTTGVTGATDSFGYMNGGFDFTYYPEPAIPYNRKVRVWTGFSGGSVYLNGGSAVSSNNNNWTTLVSSGSGFITSIRFTVGSSGGWWSGLEVDDEMLIDPVFKRGDVDPTAFNPLPISVDKVRGEPTNVCIMSQAATFDGDESDIQNGGLKFECPSSGDATSRGTIRIPSGSKFYMEATYNEVAGSGGQARLGIAQTDRGNTKSGSKMFSVDFRGSAGNIQSDDEGTTVDISAGQPGDPATGDTVGIKVDLRKGTLDAHLNGIYYGGEGGLISGIPNLESDFFAALDGGSNRNDWDDINFGQKPWKYPPSYEYKPLSAANVTPEKVFARPDQYVGISTWNGNNATRDIMTGFAPDLVIIKRRDGTKDWAWYDSVRGATKRISSNDRDNETTDSSGLTSFNDLGFTMGNSTFNNGDSKTYVSYSFKAGGSSGTFNVDGESYASAAAAGLDDGSINPSGASVGTKQGFSIIQWEGTNNNKNISHGLTQAPEFIINKNIDVNSGDNSDWFVGTPYLSNSNFGSFLELNDSGNQQQGNSDVWSQGGVPNETTFGVGAVGNGTGTHIAYLWHSVPGLQKFGKYRGNGDSNNGPLINLGFRPAILCIRKYTGGDSWFLTDTARNYKNPTNEFFKWNDSIGGNTDLNLTNGIDLLSTGFRLMTTDGGVNASGSMYFYMAWAEAPTYNLFGAQANAR